MKRWVTCALLLWATRASAGAWTRDAGHGYVGTGWSRIAATSVFGPDGKTLPIAAYEQNAWSLYGELGLISRWLTATVESTLVRDNAQAGAHTTGMGDWRFGAWSGVVDKPVRLSLGATVTVPLGSPTPRDLQPGRLPLGSGELALDVRAAFGWSWPGGRYWPLRHYVIVEAGYWRRQLFADAFVYRAELGVQLPWRVVERVWLVGRLLGVESFASDARASADPTGLDEGFTVVAPGVEGVVRLWRGLAVGAGFETALRARAVAAGKQLHATVSGQW
ncbi:MAG: hypothetical protein JWM53_2470 [bacterium]|nr:hypothetical protein [bacterium]